MGELFGLVFLFACTAIIIFFSVGLLGSMDEEAIPANMSDGLQHAYNVTEDAVDVSFSMSAFYPAIICLVFLVALCMWLWDKYF